MDQRMDEWTKCGGASERLCLKASLQSSGKSSGRLKKLVTVSRMVLNKGKKMRKGVYDRYDSFKFWDWLATGVSTRRNAFFLTLWGLLVFIWALYMCTLLQFAKGQVQFFPEDTNIHQYEVTKTHFSSSPESCDFRCIDSVEDSIGSGLFKLGGGYGSRGASAVVGSSTNEWSNGPMNVIMNRRMDQ